MKKRKNEDEDKKWRWRWGKIKRKRKKNKIANKWILRWWKKMKKDEKKKRRTKYRWEKILWPVPLRGLARGRAASEPSVTSVLWRAWSSLWLLKESRLGGDRLTHSVSLSSFFFRVSWRLLRSILRLPPRQNLPQTKILSLTSAFTPPSLRRTRP